MELHYRGSGKVYYADKEYQCDLYDNVEQGGILLNINVTNDRAFGSFLEVPLEIASLCGQLESGFKFTLLELRRTGMKDLLSYGKSVYTYVAGHELYGIGERGQSEPAFHKVRYVLSDIVEWGGESIYAVGEKHELTRKNEGAQKSIYRGQGFSITYLVYGSFLPIVNYELLNDQIKLEQHGVIEISFEKEERLVRFNDVFEKVKRLIEISILKRINIEKVNAYSSTFVEKYGEKTVERSIEVYGKNIIAVEPDKASRSRSFKWIRLSELIDCNAFEHYFDKHKKLAPIIELFLEPFYIEMSSETRVFLNIVQALETYHSRFITNDFGEFRKRVVDLTKERFAIDDDVTREYLMAKSKKYITLESRMADLLLANWEVYFDTGEISHREFPSVIAHSRNYYIHYDERLKEKYRVLTEEELEIYNRVLL